MDLLGIFGRFLFMVFLLSNSQACTREDLEMVQIISKHCSVSPSSVYPEDPNSASVWKEGLNDLTMLGKFQAYALGVFLRNFYGDFITSDPNELEVHSSADKSAVKSAQSLVTALYSPSSYWEVVQNFPWQPIYIKYDSEDGQYKKFLSKRPCLAADLELKRVTRREAGALLQTYQDLMYYWSKNSGMSLKNIDDVEELFEILLSEFAHNLTIPEWSQSYWNELKYLHQMSASLRTKTAKLIRLEGGPLADYTVETMRQKVLNDQDPRKMIVYATHTAPMLGLLAAFSIKEVDYLPPCSTLLMEMYKKEGEYFVRFLLLNSTTPQTEPQDMYSLRMPGCLEFCPLNYVIEYTRDIIPKSWEEECLLI